MSARNTRKGASRLNPFSGDKSNLEEVADEIFGASPEPEFNTGRITAPPVPLDEIWADVRQPRRAVPASIRLVWNGNPADVPALLQTWASVAADAAGRTINLQQIILGEGDGVDTDSTPAVYSGFIDLLRLAGSILRDGLINPITIIDQRDRHLIESGERRWLAYWLLRLHTPAGDEFARIPAVAVSGADFVWRQAAENTARRSLNAVSMARQLALLVMAARGQDQYADYEMIVPPGGSDRRFYAQIADGNTHRIPRGSGERIQAAMGLSMEQLARYRRLLHLTDDEEINDVLWLRGDIEDWPEGAFRQTYTLPIGKVREILDRDSWSYADFRPADEAKASAEHSPPLHEMGRGSGGGDKSPAGGSLTGAEQAEARRVLDDIRQGFNRVFALESSPDGRDQLVASRATRLLNQAQVHYETNHLERAKIFLEDATRILNEVPKTSPLPAGGEGLGVGSGEGAGGEGSGMSEYDQQRLLKWAWRWAIGHLEGGGWFTQQDCQAAPFDLDTLILKGYLQQGTTHKASREIVRYRITPVGCRFLGAGFDVIDWAAREQPQPGDSPSPFTGRGSGGEVGVGSASDNPPSAGSAPQPVVDRAQPIFTLLSSFQGLARMTGHSDAVDSINGLLEMTTDTLRALAEDDRLEDLLAEYSASVNEAMFEWSNTITDFLNDLI